jgi:ABC-2 type transport system permease protein
VVDGTDSLAASQALGNLAARVSAFGVARIGAALAGRAPAIEVRTRAWYNPDLKSLLSMVPGLLAIVMILPALALTLAVTREKEVGTLEALIASPVQPAEYLLGKLAAYMLSGLVSAALAVAVALLWFGVPFRGSFGLFMALAAIYYLASMGLSLIVAQLVHSQQTAMLLVLFVFFVPSFFVAGLIQPVDTTSRASVMTSYALPSSHFIAIARSVFLKGAGLAQLQGHVAALLLVGLVSLALSLLLFRKRIGG